MVAAVSFLTFLDIGKLLYLKGLNPVFETLIEAQLLHTPKKSSERCCATIRGRRKERGVAGRLVQLTARHSS